MLHEVVINFCIGWLFANIMCDEDVPWSYYIPISLSFGAYMVSFGAWLFGST